MRSRIQGIVVFIAAGALLDLLLAKALLSAEWQQPINLAILAVVAAMLAMLAIVNKFTSGVFVSKPTPESMERLRVVRARNDSNFKIALFIISSFLLSLPFVAALRHFGWSANQALIVPVLICGALYWGICRVRTARANRAG
jgi:hypothetical protein